MLHKTDPRYEPFNEELGLIAHFIHEEGVNIKACEFPKIEEPHYEELRKIQGPQELHKYLFLQLLKLENVKKKTIRFEKWFVGRRVDIYATKDNKIILIECCSCYVPKIIQYLKEPKTEIWIITDGLGPWDKKFPKSEYSKWFILRRGLKWKELYEKYLRYKKIRLTETWKKVDALLEEIEEL